MSYFDIERGRRSCAEKFMASLGVSVAIKLSSCITYAIFDLKLTGFIYISSAKTSPLTSLLTRPARIFKSEDLPAPDGPIMAHSSPASTFPESPFKILVFLDSKAISFQETLTPGRGKTVEPWEPSEASDPQDI